MQSMHCLPSEKPSDASPLVVKEVEKHCGLLPPGYPEFGHYVPVEYLLTMSNQQVGELPGLEAVLAPFAVGDVTYPLARKGAYATEQVAGAISGRNLLHRNVLTSQHQQRTAQAPEMP